MAGLLKRIGDTAFALRFLRLLTMPWTKTAAYKAGIIDDEGNRIKKPETSEEKAAYTVFIRLTFNVRRLLAKVPVIGKHVLSRYAAALYLIKEETGADETDILWSISEATGVEITDEDLAEILAENDDTSGLQWGIYTLTNGSNVLVENGTPIGTFLGIDIFQGIERDTNEKITFSKYDINTQK